MYSPMEMENIDFYTWLAKGKQRRFIALLSMGAGCISGLAFIVLAYSGANVSMIGQTSYLSWLAIPFAVLVWGILRWRINSAHIDWVLFIFGCGLFTLWAMITPVHHGLNDLILFGSPFSVLVWFSVLVAVIASINLLVVTRNSQSILIYFVFFTALSNWLVQLYPPLLPSTKIGALVGGLSIFGLPIFLFSTLIEIAFLLSWEFRKQKL